MPRGVDRLALLVLATALLVFAVERQFSHFLPGARWDVTVALAAFLALLLIAGRDPLPSRYPLLASVSAILVSGLAGYRMGGFGGLVLVALGLGLATAVARRVGASPTVVIASLCADFALLRALGDPMHASPLPTLEAMAALAVPLVTLPYALRPGHEAVLRWGTWLVGTAMFSLLTERYFMRVASILAPDDIYLAVAGTGLLVLTAASRRLPRGRFVAALGVAALVLVALLLLDGTTFVNDSPLSIDEAARALGRGEDPYQTVDIVEAAQKRGLTGDIFTEYADGSAVERRLPYPAGAFLPSAVLLAVGVSDIRYGFLAFLALAYLAALLRAPNALAPFVGVIAILNVIALRQVVVAGVEPSWALFVVLAFAMSRLGGALAGLAAAARQTAWLYLPWLALERWRQGPLALTRWTLLAVGAFVLINAPFIVHDPASWLAGVTAPFVTPYVALGSGVVNLSLNGPFPLAPREAYTLAFAAAFALALWTYAHDRAGWRYGLAVLPVAPLFFAWRSLQSYFMFAPLFLLALILEDPEEPRSD